MLQSMQASASAHKDIVEPKAYDLIQNHKK